MTTRNIAGHTGRSALINDDPVAIETVAARRELERQDHAFVAQLRAAILAGQETARGCIGLARRPS
jgi:hypothetical protein